MENKRITEIIAENEIRKIIDLYGNYADTKENEKQAALFTNDFTVEIYFDPTTDTPSQKVQGKENLKKLFADNLNPFIRTVHFNAQNIVTIKNENEAEGIVYCRAYHLSKENDDTDKFMIAAIRYLDQYRKEEGKWYFSERKLMVQWIENR
jgi:ketosteroid isomerase-like protein